MFNYTVRYMGLAPGCTASGKVPGVVAIQPLCLPNRQRLAK